MNRAETERRPTSQALGRRAIAKDQAGDDLAMLSTIEGLGHRLESPLADLHQAAWVGLEVACPQGALARRHEDRSVGLVDEPDRHLARTSTPTTGGRQQDDPAVAAERPSDVVRGDLQRARCQDLPSVPTDGA